MENDNNDKLRIDPHFQAFLEIREGANSLDPESDEENTPLPETWRRINKKPYVEHEWRIQDLVPSGGFMILASESGSRKTWLGLEMGKCITASRNFLDCDRFKTRGCNVLYVNCENPENEIRRRGNQLGFSEESEYELYILNSDSLNLNTDEGALWLKAFVEYYDIGVVFIDTFRAVAGAIKEEKAEEIRQFFNRYSSLKNLGVTVVWLDHTRKPQNFEGKTLKKEQLLGSIDKAASVETLLMIRSEGELIDCYQRKNRLAVEIKPFQIVMKDHVDALGNIKTLLTYGGEIEDQEDKKAIAKELIVGILENGEKSSKEIIELLKKQVGSKNTRTALKELTDENVIDWAKRGRENLYFKPKNEVPKEESEIIQKKDEFF